MISSSHTTPVLNQTAEVIDRIPSAFDPFVIPYLIGVASILVWVIVGCIKLFKTLAPADRKRLLVSFITPSVIVKNIGQIIGDCLLHLKIWKRNLRLGYMHTAIAFGWFLLIICGHVEVSLFTPEHLSLSNGSLYYPIFYRYFVWANPAHISAAGQVIFFLMDFFLLYVLSGICLALFKRIRSIALGMKHTTKPMLVDRVALYSLWLIFFVRLFAESFTADLSGGSFLTLSLNSLWHALFGPELCFEPFWWIYSICLGTFFVAMPFSRYTHIFTEVFWILLRNAGVKPNHPSKGIAKAEILACSSCGMCIDACPMSVTKKNVENASVYFVRSLRRGTDEQRSYIAEKCLQCGKCHSMCPVGVNAPELRRAQRKLSNNSVPYNFSAVHSAENAVQAAGKVMYFAGCMSHITPRIIRATLKVLEASGTDYVFADRDGGICCGRPLMLSGRVDAARELIEANRQMILNSGCTTLLVSCPICYKVFKEEYNLENIEIVHYTQFVDRLVSEGRLRLDRSDSRVVYHDPCELGRGSGIYDEPRNVLRQAATLVSAQHERDESVCCGGSLGSLTLSTVERNQISQASVDNLLANAPDAIVTACPLCFKTFSEAAPSNVPVRDFAEVVISSLHSQS